RVRALRLSHDAQAALLQYHWPGNVRELEHLIGRATLKAVARLQDRSRTLTVEAMDLDLDTRPAAAHAENVSSAYRGAGIPGARQTDAAGHGAGPPGSTRSDADLQIEASSEQAATPPDFPSELTAGLLAGAHGLRDSVDEFQRR